MMLFTSLVFFLCSHVGSDPQHHMSHNALHSLPGLQFYFTNLLNTSHVINILLSGDIMILGQVTDYILEQVTSNCVLN